MLQIGGNDMLYGENPRTFERTLDELVARVTGADRYVVMLELPAFPLREAHTRAQRRVAARHAVTMIPRRYFLHVIRPRHATGDGVHLTEAGHRRMYEMMRHVLRRALVDGHRGGFE